MGIVHKITAEVTTLIVEEKKKNSLVSCRKLSRLIEGRFGLKVSKSSINAIIKEAGLSLPVGRRGKKKPQPAVPPAPVTPILIEAESEKKLLEEIHSPAIKLPERKEEIPLPPIELPEVREETPVKAEEPAEELTIAETAPAQEELPQVKEPVAEKPPIPEIPIEPEIELPAPEEEKPLELPCTALVLLKAAESLVGGISALAESLKHKTPFQGQDMGDKLEYVLYSLLAQEANLNLDDFLRLFLEQSYTPQDAESCIRELQLKGLNLDIGRSFSLAFREIRCLKLTLSDKSTVYLDAQFRSVWPTPYVPYGFSSTLYSVKKNISRYLLQDAPLLLFIAPQQEYPPEDFFNFILNLDSGTQHVTDVQLYTELLDEIEHTTVAKVGRRSFLFGITPRQFGGRSQIKSPLEFRPVSLNFSGKIFYAGETTAQLSQPVLDKTISLRALVLRKTQGGGDFCVILTNITSERMNTEELARLYLEHCPEFEDELRDYTQKIDLFSYLAENYHAFSLDDCIPQGKGVQDIRDVKSLFAIYLKALDRYVKRHFLPFGHEEKDFYSLLKSFYNEIAGVARREKEYILVDFSAAAKTPQAGIIRHACNRVNESRIFLGAKRRLFLKV